MREIHGVQSAKRMGMSRSEDDAPVTVTDGTDDVLLRVRTTDGFYASLTPTEARFIARLLVDAASRVEGPDA